MFKAQKNYLLNYSSFCRFVINFIGKYIDDTHARIQQILTVNSNFQLQTNKLTAQINIIFIFLFTFICYLIQMHQSHINETEIMERNLQKLMKNQNYFSCFIQNPKQQEPTNPFQKKLFDKNLRRSAISCGHYNSQNQQSSISQEIHPTASSRRSSLMSNNNNPQILQQSSIYAQLITHQPKFSTSHKVSLAQSRHSDPTKQQITQIINNFRLQLDYLEEKLHHKVDQLNCRYGDRQCSQKERQAQFMIESLQKIVGFMVENCVNLEDSVMYGEKDDQNSGRHTEVMRKQVYQIDEDEEQENMSFNNHSNVNQFRPTHRFSNKKENLKEKSNIKKRKIVGMMEKENLNSGNNQQQQQRMPQTYYINNKLHTSNENANTSKSNEITRVSNQQHQKPPTKRTSAKSSNSKTIQNSGPQSQPYHYHSSKQTLVNHTQGNNASHSHNDSNQGVKSIYETVLEEREMRMKMKKKII